MNALLPLRVLDNPLVMLKSVEILLRGVMNLSKNDVSEWGVRQLDVRPGSDTCPVEIGFTFVDTAPVRLFEFKLTDWVGSI